jgi:hypothetical protein
VQRDLGEFRFGNPGFDGLTTEGTEGHRGLLSAYGYGEPALWTGGRLLGTLVVHRPSFAQAVFSVKVRCHKKKINIGWGCGKLSGGGPRSHAAIVGCGGGGESASTTKDTKVHEGKARPRSLRSRDGRRRPSLHCARNTVHEGKGYAWANAFVILRIFVVSKSGAKLSLLFEFELGLVFFHERLDIVRGA